MKNIAIVILLQVICLCKVYSQNYTPVVVTGFNQDVIAEAGTDATAVTTSELDLVFNILYSTTFATANAITNGIPANGTISNGGYNFQLEDYTLNNALFLSTGGVQPNTLASGTLTLTTPASYSKISLLSFSTEFYSVMNVVINFTDGTSTTGSQQTVADWFDGQNPVIAGFGRVKRNIAGPYLVDGANTNNPRFYPFNIALSCEEQAKLVSSITVTHISGGGANSRGVILAVAGVTAAPMSIIPGIVPAACGQSNGSISLDVSGGVPLITYEWNTSPVQLTATASNLPAGSYTCTVTDANLCPDTVQVDLTEKSVVRLKATARPADICSGSSTTLAAIPSGGIILGYEWLPGNSTDSSISVAPADTASYIVKGKDVFGCYATDTIQVTVTQRPPAPVSASLSLCPDSTATLSIQSPDDSLVYNWYPYPSGGDIYNTGDVYVTPAVAATTTYYVEAVRGVCRSDRTPVTVTPFDRPVSPVVSVKTITTTGAVFTWKSIPGSTGYLVSIDGGAYVTVTDTTYEVPQIQKDSVTIRVISLGALSCQTSLAGTATAKLKPLDIFVPNAFTPNGDGKNDIFKPEGSMKALNMKIFNQWGELICETNSGWNGSSGGKAQPMGVYMYTMKIILTNGSEIIKKGAVNLLR